MKVSSMLGIWFIAVVCTDLISKKFVTYKFKIDV